ncbi:aconitate hydratase [Aquisalimonas sp.]|uniref:aconitate hydratase n=1 Tax=Aquisalimonas sp. TaxID=1872621 RepID=UPI0025C60704|nr:aconitate hydratase [Aquisalimonas sp.]
MARTLAHQLIDAHLVEGRMEPGEEIAIAIDQTLTQDATGTLAMLELEAMGVDRVAAELSAQYVDHNLIQEDFRNPDDHLFLYSACRRFGLWFSGAGNGVSHPVHMQRFGRPGKTLLGSDSHTCAAGSMGMLAIGAGGLDVAMAMAGRPFYTNMPEIWGVELTGELPEWVSAKDVILEMLRRHGTDGGRGRIIEYHGEGLAGLSAMDRHVIANMGAELGATATVFPSDEATREFLAAYSRDDDWMPLAAEKGCSYDVEDHIDLSALEPLIAKPASPGNVVPVRDVAGDSLYQAYIGSSANPGYRDFAISALMVAGRRTDSTVSFDINPTSRTLLEDLTRTGLLLHLLQAGARLHQAGCNGCIGMGQAPATGQNSLRTVPRNFPGRSGTREDSVFLCSPETATASALAGKITDPRDLGVDYPQIPEAGIHDFEQIHVVKPLPPEEARQVDVVKGPNIVTLPEFEGLPERLELPVLLEVHDYITTDEIMPAGARVLPYRSNIPAISRFCFDIIDESYPQRAEETGSHAIVAGRDYGQGSSREHAALAPRYLGLRAVLARSFARIAWQNLISFGILPLRYDEDEQPPKRGETVVLEDLHEALTRGNRLTATVNGRSLALAHDMSARQVEIVLAGGMINHVKQGGGNA